MVVKETRQRSGWPIKQTLWALGVSPASYYRWLKEESWAKALRKPPPKRCRCPWCVCNIPVFPRLGFPRCVTFYTAQAIIQVQILNPQIAQFTSAATCVQGKPDIRLKLKVVDTCSYQLGFFLMRERFYLAPWHINFFEIGKRICR